MHDIFELIEEATERIRAGEDPPVVLLSLGEDEGSGHKIRSFYFQGWWTHTGSEKFDPKTWPFYRLQCKSPAHEELVLAVKPPGVPLTTLLV